MMPPLYHRVWQYLKYKTNHQAKKIPMRDGGHFEIKPGQHLTSIRNIAKGVGYIERNKFHEPNPRTIRNILNWLEQQHMISLNHGLGNRQYTLITLLQWEKYQIEESKVTVRAQGGAQGHTPEGKQFVPINKNDKECTKKKDITTAANTHARDGEDGGVPTTEIVQPAQDVGGRGQIPQSSEQQLIDKYIQLRGHGLFTSPKDDAAAEEILKRVPLELAIKWLEEVFQSYRPKHPRDRINSLDYCVGPIFDRFEQSRKQNSKHHRKRGIKRDEEYQRRAYQYEQVDLPF